MNKLASTKLRNKMEYSKLVQQPIEKDSEVKLHFFCGKIASGKSTRAKQLMQEKKAILVSEDQWLATLYPEQIKNISDYIEMSQRLKSILEEHLIQLIKNGNTLILDFPANTAKQRNWLKGLADKANVASLCHVLMMEDEECKKRLSIRNQSNDNPFKTSESDFEIITQHFSYPADDEQLSLQYD